MVSVRRVAQRYLLQTQHIAGILEYPPKVREQVWQWIRERYSAHILFYAEKELAPVRKWKGFKEKTLTEYRRHLSEAPAKIKALRVGDAYYVEFKEPHKWKMGVKRIPDSFDTAYYVSGSGSSGARFEWEKYGESSLETILEWAEEHLKDEIGALEETDSPLSNTNLLDWNMLRKECLKYASKAEPIKDFDSRLFSVDLTGWKYIASIPNWKEILFSGGTPFSSKMLTVVLSEKPHPTRGGQWSSSEMKMEIDAPGDIPDRVSEFHDFLDTLEETLDHEMRHLAQSALSWLRGKPDQYAGMPSKTIRPRDDEAAKLPRDPNRPGAPAHALRDVEFHTRLGDEVRGFLGAIKNLPKDARRWALRKRVGLSTENEEDPQGVQGGKWVATPFFSMLKQHQPDKWRKAVTEFEKAVSNQIDIPSEEENLDFQTMHKNEPTRLNPFGMSPLGYWQARMKEIYGNANEYPKSTKDQLENDLWPQVKEEYRRFIGKLSPQQLLRHKQKVQRPGSYAFEYYLTPRWERFDGQNTLEEAKYDKDGHTLFPEHPKLVGLSR